MEDNTGAMHTSGLIFGFTTLAQAPANAPAPGTNELILWAVVLIGVAVALFFAELFVPSGGLLGACAALSLIGGIVMLFRIDTTLGLIGAILSVLAIPFALYGAMKIWPHTPVGRALTLGSIDEEMESAYDEQVPPPAPTHESSVEVGTRGKALTDLRPVGVCLLDGKRCECLSESDVIPAGSDVSVVFADGMQIKVRLA